MRDEPLLIDCGTCTKRHTDTCEDCVVTFICERTPGDAVVVQLADFRAMRMLGDVGLVPPLRHSEGSVPGG